MLLICTHPKKNQPIQYSVTILDTDFFWINDIYGKIFHHEFLRFKSDMDFNGENNNWDLSEIRRKTFLKIVLSS